MYKENADIADNPKQKKVWDDMARALRQETSKNVTYIIRELARERFYTLKQDRENMLWNRTNRETRGQDLSFLKIEMEQDSC